MPEIYNLPGALQIRILSFCDANELFRCGQVCHAWHEYVAQEEPWYALATLNACRAMRTTYELHAPVRAGASADGALSRSKRRRPMGMHFAEVFYVTPRSGNGSGDYAHPRAGLPWVNSMRCPIPPPPQSASLGHEFAWTSIERRFDGGHGGAREYTMRCLRYFSLNPATTYGTYLGDDSVSDASDVASTADGNGSVDSDDTGSAAPSAAAAPAMDGGSQWSSGAPTGAPAYDWSSGATTQQQPSPWMFGSNDNGGGPSPWDFSSTEQHSTSNGTNLLDELFAAPAPAPTWRQTDPPAHGHASSQRPRHAPHSHARQQRFEKCYECTCFRRLQQVQPRGAYSKPNPTQAPKSSGSDRSGARQKQLPPLYILSADRCCLVSPSMDVWSTSVLTHLRLASAQRRDRQRAGTLDQHEREETQDGSEGLFQGSEVRISFKVDYYACTRPSASVSGRMHRTEHGNTPSCFIGFVEAAQAHRFQLQPGAASQARRRQMASATAAVRARGAAAGADDDDDDVANMIAALAEDIQAKEAAQSDPEDPVSRARRWWSSNPPASSSAGPPLPGSLGGNFPSRGDGNDRYGSRQEESLIGSAGGSGADVGGVFIGDCEGSYGLSLTDGYLHQNGAAHFLADVRQRRASGGAASEAMSSTYTLVFSFGEDCISLHRPDGGKIATVLVDAFSEGQTWMPAVSCRGCGVSILPPTLSSS